MIAEAFLETLVGLLVLLAIVESLVFLVWVTKSLLRVKYEKAVFILIMTLTVLVFSWTVGNSLLPMLGYKR